MDSEIQTDVIKGQRDRQEKPTGHRDNAELIELEKERYREKTETDPERLCGWRRREEGR